LEDVELSGGPVRAGEPVLLAKHAANRELTKAVYRLLLASCRLCAICGW
jgi:hypothetical protein